MSISAPVACGTCRRQKKRCDRRLPSCSRCIFVLKECKYGDDPQQQVILQYTKEGYEATLTRQNLLFRCPDIDFQFLHNALMHDNISELHLATVNHVLNFLSSMGGSLEKMLGEYLRTVGSWLPMISRKKLYRSVSHILSMPRADFALLLLSIYLVLQPPFHPRGASAARSPIYQKTKQLFGLLQSAELLSIEMVQSALLITVYEYGHGYFQPAFLSVGGCARMAHVLGWDQRRALCDESILEEERRVWWAVRLFERLLDLEPEFSPSGNSHITTMELPTENVDWDLQPDIKFLESPFSQTAYLQAQSTQLLDRAINLISNPPSNIEDRREEVEALKSSLVQFAIDVTNCSRDVWGANCGTLGLTYSAIYHLHLSPSPSAASRTASLEAEADPTSTPPRALFELHRTTRIVVDIAHTFRDHRLCTVKADMGVCLPLTLHALYHASLTHIALAEPESDEFRSGEWGAGLEALRDMLGIVKGRWGLAERFLASIQAAYDAKMHEIGATKAAGTTESPMARNRAQWRSSVGI